MSPLYSASPNASLGSQDAISITDEKQSWQDAQLRQRNADGLLLYPRQTVMAEDGPERAGRAEDAVADRVGMEAPRYVPESLGHDQIAQRCTGCSSSRRSQ